MAVQLCRSAAWCAAVLDWMACVRIRWPWPRCRRWRERQAIFALDDGCAPPLCPRGGGGTWGRLLGTQQLDPSPLTALKATAVGLPPGATQPQPLGLYDRATQGYQSVDSKLEKQN